jgi:hypothetical protein
MAKKRIESTTDHKGPMRVVRSDRTKCGWCLSNDCESCKPELTYYDRIYVCGCKCQDGYVPQVIKDGTAKIQEEKEVVTQDDDEQEGYAEGQVDLDDESPSP